MTLKISAASSTVLAMGPTWSRLEAMAITPERETAPYVGESPTTPQKLVGWRLEPPMSDPKAPKATCEATAAAHPPEEPPAPLGVSWRFFGPPKANFSIAAPNTRP